MGFGLTCEDGVTVSTVAQKQLYYVAVNVKGGGQVQCRATINIWSVWIYTQLSMSRAHTNEYINWLFKSF